MKKRVKGFTIIELLVVVGIIAVLATISMVAYDGAKKKSRDSKRIGDVNDIHLAIQMYYQEKGYYPTESSGWAYEGNTLWNTLQTDLNDYLNPLPVDPLNKVGGYRYFVDIEASYATIIKVKLEQSFDKAESDDCPDNIEYYDRIVGKFSGAEPGLQEDNNNKCNGSGSSDGYPDF